MLEPDAPVSSPTQPRSFRADGVQAPHTFRAAPSRPIRQHARVLLDYFNTLKANSQTDVEVKCGGREVGTAHRLILAAFSPQFKSAILALLAIEDAPTCELDIDPVKTGIPWNVLAEVVDFCYTGQCRFSDKLLRAARFLQCQTLTSLLEKAQEDASSSPSYLHQQILVDEYHAATLLDEVYQMKLDRVFLDCVFGQSAHRSDNERVHRLVLCAYTSRHFETTLREHAERAREVAVVIDLPQQLRATKQDLLCVVDFFYRGVVRAATKRLRVIREVAQFIGAQRLVAEIESMLASGGSEEEGVQHAQHLQQAEYEEVLEMEYAEEADAAARPGSSMMQEGAMEEEYIGGDEHEEGMMQSPYMGDYEYLPEGAPMQQQQPQHMQDPSDVVDSSIEEYSHIYQQYVVGPRKGKREGTYLRRPSPVKAKEPATNEQENEECAEEMQPAVTLTRPPPTSRPRQREVDSYGYRLPEIHTSSAFEVPLVVGEQQEMMERPFKCSYCNHRTREKSAIEKHERCMHTLETPFSCKFCPQKFKVQSNLVRHHRSHTGEKPYVCRKCGTAYADKKNMDAHVYREHLKQRQLACNYPNCVSKFWRQDRFILHYNKQHGPFPEDEQERAASHGWADQ